jgi:DEAD/DEAH box helicase domain-containing protein
MALVSRDRARGILEQLVGSLDQLVRVDSIAEIYINPNFNSELEARFIESLRRLSGEGGLPFVKLVQHIVQGKSGYLLVVGEQRYWVEPQVDLGPSEGVSAACRPDFVLWPSQSRSPRRPIAIFCDGLLGAFLQPSSAIMNGTPAVMPARMALSIASLDSA